jgi:sugar lactone lactonase YvrE
MLFRHGHAGIRSLPVPASQLTRRHVLRTLSAFTSFLALGSCLEAQSTYTPYDFEVLAGIYGSEEGPGAAVHLNYVVTVAVDSSGTVYFSDDPNCVRKVTPGGMVTTVAGIIGAPGSADGMGPVARFLNVTSVAVGADGNIYVTDGSAIRKMTPGGVVSTLAGNSGASGSADGPGATALFNGPLGVAADQNGNVYVSDSENQTIREIAPSGVVTTLAGSAGVVGSADGTGAAARFHNPHGIVVDAGGNVFVADSENFTIRKIAQGGLVSSLAGSAGNRGSNDGTGPAARFAFPTFLALDPDGNIFVADDSDDGGIVRKVTPGGTVTTPIGLSFQGKIAPGDGTSIVSALGGGLAVDTADNLYLAAATEGVIWKVTPGRIATALAGTGAGTFDQTIGSADGSGVTARFFNPAGVAVDASGNVYVSDSGNGTIRKILPGGAVTTLAGTADVTGYADGTGGAAIFGRTQGIAVDGAGNLYLADSSNNVIRKITPDGVVTTLAGTASIFGSTDGTGPSARFSDPLGVAVDSSGNVYVADTGNNTIRKITPGGVVTTLAGSPGAPGYMDGTGSAAMFNNPIGIAVDTAGNVYVGESGYEQPAGTASFFHYNNDTIRKITPDGVVTTLAGLPYTIYYGPGSTPDSVNTSADGTGSAARFNNPAGLAVDGNGNVYVADEYNDTIRRVTADGVVTTLAGVAGVSGGASGTGAGALFNNPSGVAVDANGNVFVADAGNDLIRVGALGREPQLPSEPSFASPAVSQVVANDSTVVFRVSANTTTPPTYQWYYDGNAIAGATQATLVVNGATSANQGYYDCVATNSFGVSTSTATLTIADTAEPGRLIDLSCRAGVGAGGDVLIAGFVVGGPGTSGSLPLLVRASGPALIPFGVTGVLPDPDVQITSLNTYSVVAANEGWGGNALISSAASAVGAFPWTNPSSGDSALLEDLPSGPYTATVAGVSGNSGVALAEVYDATPGEAYSSTSPRLVNISARTSVGQGSDVLIAGFVIGGTTSKTVLIRASGPALVPFGVSGVLPDPELQLYNSGGMIASNTGWGGDGEIAAASTSVGAFSWGATATADSALLVTLPPGAYTAEVSGSSGDTGIALVEVYEVP